MNFKATVFDVGQDYNANNFFSVREEEMIKIKIQPVIVKILDHHIHLH